MSSDPVMNKIAFQEGLKADFSELNEEKFPETYRRLIEEAHEKEFDG